MGSFSVKLLASDRKVFEGHASLVVSSTPSGEMGFMAGHEDTIMAIETGELRITTDKGEKLSFVAGKGILQFINNRMMILTEFADLPEELEARMSQYEQDKAREIDRQRQSVVEYQSSRAAIARAIVRMKETNKYKSLGE